MPTSYSGNTPRRLAYRGLLLCLALVFSYLESMISLPIIPLPGIKLGFANLVVTLAAYVFDLKTAWMISVLRVMIVSHLFGNLSGFWFSIAGAVLSFTALACLLRFCKTSVSPLGVSVACAAAHNVGQLAAAAGFFTSSAVFSYLPILLFAGMITGSITGILLCCLLRSSFLIVHSDNTLWKGSK